MWPSSVISSFTQRLTLPRYRIFVSYSREHTNIAQDYYNSLLEIGSKRPLDIQSVVLGEYWQDRVESEIAACSHLVMLWCDHAGQSAEVVEETGLAAHLGKPIIPVVIGSEPLPAQPFRHLPAIYAAPDICVENAASGHELEDLAQQTLALLEGEQRADLGRVRRNRVVTAAGCAAVVLAGCMLLASPVSGPAKAGSGSDVAQASPVVPGEAAAAVPAKDNSGPASPYKTYAERASAGIDAPASPQPQSVAAVVPSAPAASDAGDSTPPEPTLQQPASQASTAAEADAQAATLPSLSAPAQVVQPQVGKMLPTAKSPPGSKLVVVAHVGGSDVPLRPTADPVSPRPLAANDVANAVVKSPPAPTMPKAAAKSGFVIQVQSKPTQADALAYFADLQHRFTTLLGNKQPEIKEIDLAGKTPMYRLRLGPPGDAADAVNICQQLKAAGLEKCDVVPF